MIDPMSIVDPTLNSNLWVSVECENAVLAAALLEPTLIDFMIEQGMSSKFFYREKNERIWNAMIDLKSMSRRIDIRTLDIELNKRYPLGSGEWMTTLTYLDVDLPDISGVPSYINILRDLWVGRTIQFSSLSLLNKARKSGDLQDLLAFISEMRIAAEEGITSTKVDLADAVAEAIERLEERVPSTKWISTPFYTFDKVCGGVPSPGLTVVAARPGVGKTTFSLNLMSHFIKCGLKCLFISIEMTREQATELFLSHWSGVERDKLSKRIGDLSTDDWRQLHKAADDIESFRGSLIIDDGSRVTPSQIMSKAMVVKPDVLVVDYAGIVTIEKKMESRALDVAEIVKSLTMISKELKISVIGISQFNREVEKDSRPRLGHLAESASLEHNAAMVLGMVPDKNVILTGPNQAVELWTIKHRFGRQDVKFQLLLSGDRGTFRELTTDYDTPD